MKNSRHMTGFPSIGRHWTPRRKSSRVDQDALSKPKFHHGSARRISLQISVTCCPMQKSNPILSTNEWLTIIILQNRVVLLQWKSTIKGIGCTSPPKWMTSCCDHYGRIYCWAGQKFRTRNIANHLMFFIVYSRSFYNFISLVYLSLF